MIIHNRMRALVILVGVVGCGECTCETHEVVHEQHGRRVEISAQHRAGMGIGGFGAPHAFGILYPTWEDGGIRVLMTVDDRPPVVVAHAREGDVEAVAAACRVAVSEDGAHVAARYHEGWSVFHLLPKGTPFDAPGSTVTADEVDFSAFGAPEEIARALLENADEHHGGSWQLLMSAMQAQDPSPLDDSLLHGWPEGARHGDVIRARLAHPEVSDAFREAVFERAKVVIADIEANEDQTAFERQSEVAMIDVIVLLGPERVAWLDERMVSRWEAHEGAMPLRLWAYMASRRALRAPFERAEPMAAELRARAAAAGRRWLDAHHVVDGKLRLLQSDEGGAWDNAVSWIVLEGTDADERWLHDLLLASWPVEGSMRHVHNNVVGVAAGRLGTPSAAWRARALREADRAIGSPHSLDATHLLIALEAPQETKDRAFQALVDEGGVLAMGTVKRERAHASEHWRRGLIQRARATENDSALRALAFELALDFEDCEALHELAPNGYHRDRIPPSCRAAAVSR